MSAGISSGGAAFQPRRHPVAAGRSYDLVALPVLDDPGAREAGEPVYIKTRTKCMESAAGWRCDGLRFRRGGDAPGLNAVIRAVVLSAQPRLGVLRHPRRLQRPAGPEDYPAGGVCPAHRPPGRRHHAPGRHDPRHHQPRQPVAVPGATARRLVVEIDRTDELVSAASAAASTRSSPSAATARSRSRSALPQGPARGRRAQDDRQRPRRHRRSPSASTPPSHFATECHRPAAHHGRVPPAG